MTRRLLWTVVVVRSHGRIAAAVVIDGQAHTVPLDPMWLGLSA